MVSDHLTLKFSSKEDFLSATPKVFSSFDQTVNDVWLKLIQQGAPSPPRLNRFLQTNHHPFLSVWTALILAADFLFPSWW